MAVSLLGFPNYEFWLDEDCMLVCWSKYSNKAMKENVIRSGYCIYKLRNGTGKIKAVYRGRLALELYGEPQPSPEHTCDHKNRKKSDDRLENLRWLTPSQQITNRTPFGKGYSWNKRTKRWVVMFKHKHYGRFKTEEEAKTKAEEIRREYTSTYLTA
jgi:hypothetical protein